MHEDSRRHYWCCLTCLVLQSCVSFILLIMTPRIFCLLFSLLLTAAASPTADISRPRTWPCPEEEVLVPCTCFADDLLNLYFDCQNLGSLDELKLILTNEFPFKKFARIQVSNSDFSNDRLDSTAFPQNFTFREVIFFGNNLFEVDPDTFTASKDELSFIEFIEPTTTFPLPADLSVMTNLREAVMGVACSGALPTWFSSTLVTLTVRCSGENISLMEYSFTFPSLTALHLKEAHLTDIAQGNFVNSPGLLTVSLDDNDLSTIAMGVLLFNNNLQLLDLSANLLTDMPQIEGMASGGVVRISENNYIEDLDETSTQALINNGVIIEAFNVTLTCGCEFQWLLGSSNDDMPLNNIIGVQDECGDNPDYNEIRDILTQLCQ